MKKTVFISGATSGIGLATANMLHQTGWHVYAGGLQTDDFSVLDDGITQLPFDITDAEGIAGAMRLLKVEAGQLDALVNNAGIQIAAPLEAVTIEQVRQQFEVNVFGHLQVTQACLPLLRQSQAARIVNVSSLMGVIAMPMLGAYSMSKHALEAMSDVLRQELSPFGIRVSVVTPAAINTPMVQQAIDQLEQVEQISSQQIQHDYAKFFKAMKATLEQQNRDALSPDKVADVIIRALTSKRPKARYAVGLDVKVLSTIRKFAPISFVDALLRRILGIK